MSDQANGAENLTVDQKLMDQVRDIVSRRDEIQELIQKAETRRGKVKDEIFAKVLSDYEEKMKAVAFEFEPVATEIRTALGSIRTVEKGLRGTIAKNSDQVEELRFRCEVGEFSEEDLKQREAENVKTLDELEKKIAVVETTYEECKRYLGQEEFELAVADDDAPSPGAEVITSDDDFIVSNDEVISSEVGTTATPEAMGDIDIPSSGDEPTPAQPPSAPGTFDDIDITLNDVDGVSLDDAPSSDTLQAPPEVEVAPTPASPPEPDPAPPAADAEYDATIAFSQRSFLKLVKEDGNEETYLLGIEALSIGRNHKNDVVLLDRSISRKHAQVMPENGKYSLMDLSSGGGIFVNGEKIEKRQLKNGDEISIGDFKLSFVEEAVY